VSASKTEIKRLFIPVSPFVVGGRRIASPHFIIGYSEADFNSFLLKSARFDAIMVVFLILVLFFYIKILAKWSKTV
jgi:hypothetical protein